MNGREYTRAETKAELMKMTGVELQAYRNILAMSLTCLQSEATLAMNEMHADVVAEIIQERQAAEQLNHYMGM